MKRSLCCAGPVGVEPVEQPRRHAEAVRRVLLQPPPLLQHRQCRAALRHLEVHERPLPAAVWHAFSVHLHTIFLSENICNRYKHRPTQCYFVQKEFSSHA